MPLIILLFSCRAANLGQQSSWSIYRNPRYNFEFPYPNNWVSFSMPDNRDGLAFRDPRNPGVEIRGWAANDLSDFETSARNRPLNSHPRNFTTQQGLRGTLQVAVGADLSLMTLSLNQGKVRYNWQGQSESEQFADYYRFFYYVAEQYRLPPPRFVRLIT